MNCSCIDVWNRSVVDDVIRRHVNRILSSGWFLSRLSVPLNISAARLLILGVWLNELGSIGDSTTGVRIGATLR